MKCIISFLLLKAIINFGGFWITVADPIGPLPCKLKWITASTDGKVVQKSIASQMGTHFVIRGMQGSEQNVIGRMQAINGTNGIALIPTGSTVKQVQVFDILQNSYDCVTEWVLPSDDKVDEFKVELEGKPIGRVMASSTLLPGEITAGGIVYVNLAEEIETSAEYYILVSYSKGLHLLLSDFEFKSDSSEGLDFLGVDEIRNEAEVEVTQTVTHSKSVTESFTFSEHGSQTISWSVALNVDFSIGFKGVGISVGAGVEFGMSYESGWETEVTTTRTREIEVSRTIIVPPLTSVQACSTIKSKENFKMGYDCLGRYSAPGFTGQEVADLLTATTDLQIYVDKDFAVAEIAGELTGSMSLSTQFIVTPIDALYGCSEMETDIKNERARLSQRNRKDFLSKLSK